MPEKAVGWPSAGRAWYRVWKGSQGPSEVVDLAVRPAALGSGRTANAPSGHGRASGTADLDLVGVSVEDRNLADTAISCGRNSHRIEA